MPHLCKYMFISNIFPSDLDVYDTMSMQVHVHFKASSPVIHMVMIAHLCKYMSISNTFPVIKMIHYSTVMESQILVDWA